MKHSAGSTAFALRTAVQGAALALLLTSWTSALAQSPFSFGYEIARTGSGDIRLKCATHVPDPGLWLGVTLYPPAGGATTSEIRPIKAGRGSLEISVDPRFTNGTFEAAIWARKIPASECQATDETCQRLGYKLITMKSYSWGQLVTR